MVVNLKKLIRDNPNRLFIYNFKKIYGLGSTTAKEICLRFSLTTNLLNKEIPLNKIEEMSYFVNENLICQAELQALEKKQRSRHIELKTYKGNRYSLRLPANGQRTHSNAAFSRGIRTKKEDRKKPSRRESVRKKRPLFFPKV